MINTNIEQKPLTEIFTGKDKHLGPFVLLKPATDKETCQQQARVKTLLIEAGRLDILNRFRGISRMQQSEYPTLKQSENMPEAAEGK